MEHRIPVRRVAPKALLGMFLVLPITAAWADEAVVLVTSSDSPIADISSLDIRKAYLGISVTIGGGTVRPLRQKGAERLNLIFLQYVLAMSEKSYERRLLSMMLKYGTPRPDEVAGREALITRLERNLHSITYMWQSEAESDPRIKTIKVLWQDH